MHKKKKTGKYQVFVFLLNMPSDESKNVVLSKSVSDAASSALTIWSCLLPAVCIILECH
ncbi:hypothetical protein Barb4_02176 [Bacteroidales bacterium Barb4]|nr:hypothetical protein Barb4_02176 [Bacteroidales bacterium Barb4]